MDYHVTLNQWSPCSENVRKECDTLVFGSIIKGLQNLDIWPGPTTPSDIDKSVSILTTDIRSLHCFALGENTNTKHTKCKFTTTLSSAMDIIMRDIMPSGVDESHKRHMEEQALK